TACRQGAERIDELLKLELTSFCIKNFLASFTNRDGGNKFGTVIKNEEFLKTLLPTDPENS
ncbi:4147_t:CDS:2, partial [Racocetra fulgida]